MSNGENGWKVLDWVMKWINLVLLPLTLSHVGQWVTMGEIKKTQAVRIEKVDTAIETIHNGLEKLDNKVVDHLTDPALHMIATESLRGDIREGFAEIRGNLKRLDDKIRNVRNH